MAMQTPTDPRWLAVALVGWSLGACGEIDLPCNPSGEIGSCCTSDTDCAPYRCIQELPRGYCSVPCADDVPCPGDATCIAVNYSGQDWVAGEFCLQSCGGGLPNCRKDHYCTEYAATEDEKDKDPDQKPAPEGKVCFR